MRKTGIYILLGITISLGVFVFAGIVYFRPAVQQARLDAEQVVVAAPRKQPTVVPEAPAVPPAVEKPGASEISPPPEPVVETEVPETLPPVEMPEVVPQEPKSEQPKPRVPSAPVMSMTVAAYESPAQVEPEPEVIEIPEEVEPVVVEEKPVPSDMVTRSKPEPELYDRPVKRIPPTPAVERSVLSVLPFLPPEPVEYIWTPVAVPEGPTEHVDPVSFSKEAFERRRIAVDEVLDKLIWE
ncbi:MAG: hypothetical protein CVV48_10775 [Spirochaetae bacterium HGW-Spirochaetae-4]|nr:MAG: hypothetical protein CVV52_10165 [Spirochaetae bacterium HGW-Spirochaetae-8]PKL20843.1 MAG: hypothetical protein CVV48_10775 [Spirochaetae bacterium HGW-Spirochaetae-4]